MNSELHKNLIQRVSVGDIFRRRAGTSPNAEAVVEKRGTQTIRLTYRNFNNRLNRFARAARELGLGKGDRIGLIGLNSAEYLIALYGCAKGGMVAVPINPGMNPKDIVYALKHAEVTVLVVDDMLYPLVNAIREHLSGIRHYIAISATGQPVPEAYISFDAFLDRGSDEEVEDIIIHDRDIFEILYTSGTTANPKGVMISHLSVFIASLATAVEFGLSPGEAATSLMPVFHCAQQAVTTATLHIGGKTVVFRGFDPAVLLAGIQQENLFLIFCLPVMYRAMLAHPEIGNTDLSSLKKCIYAMAPMDQRTLEECIRVFDADFMLGTGQTECFPPSNVFRSQWQLEKRGNYWGESCMTLDTAIMDEDGNILNAGQTGEIVWRGPAVMEAYLKDTEATEESRKFGWHHSGDLGYFDEDNQLVFVDRKKDMIKTGGENVPSIKVERVILGYPKVSAAAVVGLPHEHWIEGVTAFVVPAPGADLSENEVIELCRKELGSFEVPKKVVITKELPLTSTGKIRKNILREKYRDIYRNEF